MLMHMNNLHASLIKFAIQFECAKQWAFNLDPFWHWQISKKSFEYEKSRAIERDTFRQTKRKKQAPNEALFKIEKKSL